MAQFNIAFDKTGLNEGGVANNPADAGRMTVFGISREFWPKWAGWRIVDQFLAGMLKQPNYGTPEYNHWVHYLDSMMRKSGVLMGYVESFYQSKFWDKYRLEEIVDQDLANWLYDHIVNGGSQGVKWMQEAADIEPDGEMGDQSIKTFNGQNATVLLKMSEIVAAWYRLDKVHNKPSQAQFINSWLARDGVDQDIIQQARSFARDGLSDDEVAQLKAMIKADALEDIQGAVS